MRAVCLIAPGKLEIVDRPDPDPGPGELLLAPEAVGICGSDLEMLDGLLAYQEAGGAQYPIVLGHEWSARVLAAAPDVTGFRPGDVVVGETAIGCLDCDVCRDGNTHLCPTRREVGLLGLDGALATRMLFPARWAYIVPQAQRESAALIEPATVGMYAVRRARCADKTVLVLGAGAVGLLTMQAAKCAGAERVFVADVGRKDRLDLAERLGADAAVLLDAADPERHRAAIRHATDAAPVHVVIQCAADPAAAGLAISVVRPAGTVALVGLTGADSSPVDTDAIVINDLNVVGVAGSPGVWPDTIERVVDGSIQVDPLITHRFPLERAVEAFELVRRPEAGTVKVLVLPQS